jgi:hypothetical protein
MPLAEDAWRERGEASAADSHQPIEAPVMELGVFIPIGNNGWLISTTSPQYMPRFDLNRQVVETAERFGFDLHCR